jgi:gas vesicle protein
MSRLKPTFASFPKTFNKYLSKINCNRSRGVQKTLYMRFHENSMKNVIDLIFFRSFKIRNISILVCKLFSSQFNETIQDLTSFTFEHQKICRQKIEQAIEKTKNKVKYSISEHQENNKKAIRQKIMAVSNWNELNSVTQNGSESVLVSDFSR